MAEIADGLARAPVDAAGPVHCPACHDPLQRFQVTRARIELDACGRHGTWFDRGELVKVARELAVERAYAPAAAGPKGGHLSAAAAVGVAGVGGVLAAQQLAQQRPPDERAEILSEVADAALDIGGDTVIHGMEVSVDAVASVADGADLLGGAAEVAGAVVEVGGTVLGGALEVLGSIFDGFG